MAAALVLDAHGRSLRLLSALEGRHFTGLSQASRTVKLPSRLRRQLRDLDAAAAFVRHITEPRITLLLDEITEALGCAAGATGIPCEDIYAEDVHEEISSIAGLDIVDISSETTTAATFVEAGCDFSLAADTTCTEHRDTALDTAAPTEESGLCAETLVKRYRRCAIYFTRSISSPPL